MSTIQIVLKIVEHLYATALLCAALYVAVRKAKRDPTLPEATTTARDVMSAVVARRETTTVRDLKDPAMPGEWNAATQATTRDAALGDALRLAPDLPTLLRRAGIADPAEYLRAELERAVVTQKPAAPPPAGDRPTPVPGGAA